MLLKNSKNIIMDTFKIKIDVWSDFPCPFCYIGKRHLEASLKNFEHKDKVEVVFRSFQLNPHAEKNQKKTIYAHLSEKYGMPIERAKASAMNISNQAKKLGLEFNFDTAILTNSYDAHRLTQYAIKQGKMDELVERIMKAYFTDSKDIGDHDTLVSLAKEVGLNEEEARAVLKEEKYKEEVARDIKEASRLDIHGVPFFLFNDKDVISGAQPVEVFSKVLQKVWKEGSKETSSKAKKAEVSDSAKDECGDGSCKL